MNVMYMEKERVKLILINIHRKRINIIFSYNFNITGLKKKLMGLRVNPWYIGKGYPLFIRG